MSVEHLGIKTNVASKCKQTKLLKFNWQQQFKSGKTQWQERKIYMYVKTHETKSNTQPTSLDMFDYFYTYSNMHICTILICNIQSLSVKFNEFLRYYTAMCFVHAAYCNQTRDKPTVHAFVNSYCLPLHLTT